MSSTGRAVIPQMRMLPMRIPRSVLIATDGLPMNPLDGQHYDLTGYKMWAERGFALLKMNGLAPWATLGTRPVSAASLRHVRPCAQACARRLAERLWFATMMRAGCRWGGRFGELAVAAAVIGGLGGAAFAGLLYHHGRDPRLPRVEALAAYSSLSSTRVVDRNGLLLGEVGAARHSPVPFEQISPALVQAALAEEPAFLKGSGPDWRGLARRTDRQLPWIRPRSKLPAGITHAAARRAFAAPEPASSAGCRRWCWSGSCRASCPARRSSSWR